MLPLPGSCVLKAQTPTEFDRFTPVSYVEINSESAATLAPGADKLLARSSSAVRIDGSNQSAGTAVHPEGSPISHRDCLVSTQNITDTHVAVASYILEHCEGLTEGTQITVFIYILGGQIDYYVVNHDTKSIVWTAGQTPESFQGATRTKHEHEYWIHMENFPAPRFSTPEDLSSLKQALSSSAIDALTSEGSTSPMSVQQIQVHLKSLESIGNDCTIHQTYAVARLWNLILQSRVINKYGTPEARLDRFTSISENPPAFAGAYALIARLMFKRPHSHLGRCSRAWADRIAYTEEWRKFKATNEQEWKQVMSLACALAIASLLVRKQGSLLLRMPSHTALLTALASAASAYWLLDESQNSGEHAADASTYFQEREEITYGVQRIAIINATPQALLFWSFAFFLVSVFLL